MKAGVALGLGPNSANFMAPIVRDLEALLLVAELAHRCVPSCDG